MKKTFITPVVKRVEMRPSSILSGSEPSAATQSLVRGTGTRPNVANAHRRTGSTMFEWD